MKFNKGFGLISIILIIFGILVLVSGAYYINKNYTTSEQWKESKKAGDSINEEVEDVKNKNVSLYSDEVGDIKNEVIVDKKNDSILIKETADYVVFEKDWLDIPNQPGINSGSIKLYSSGRFIMEYGQNYEGQLSKKRVSSFIQKIKDTDILTTLCISNKISDYKADYIININGKEKEIKYPGCENKLKEIEENLSISPYDFSVNYYARNSSNSGDRILNIKYIVKGGDIRSCLGTYEYPLSMKQREDKMTGNNVEQCSLEKLTGKGYNVPLELVKSLNKQKINDEVQDGPSRYKYQIIWE